GRGLRVGAHPDGSLPAPQDARQVGVGRSAAQPAAVPGRHVDGLDRGVQAGDVAASGQDADVLHARASYVAGRPAPRYSPEIRTMSPESSPERISTWREVERPILMRRTDVEPRAETTTAYGPCSSVRTASIGRSSALSIFSAEIEARAIIPGRKLGSVWSSAIVTGKERDSFFSEAPRLP